MLHTHAYMIMYMLVHIRLSVHLIRLTEYLYHEQETAVRLTGQPSHRLQL